MICQKSYAKINLSLEVLAKRPDGYHEIDTLMNRIDLFDEIYMEEITEDKLILESNESDFPNDETNLIYRAWKILKVFKKDGGGIKIFVKKNIPISAGLAGGTSNGCQTMKLLNEFWKLGLSNEKLKEMSSPLGADSSFFFHDGLVRARGIGDKIENLTGLNRYPLLLINIGKPLSSKEIYESLKGYSQGRLEKIVENLGDFNYFKDHAFNNMEEVAFERYPELRKIKELLKLLGAEVSLMSGSGPTIFGIWKDEKNRDLAYDKVKFDFKHVIKSQFI